MSSTPEIYADFQNADPQGRVRFNCFGTVNDLSRQQVQLREGLDVVLYSPDADENDREMRLVIDGTVTYSQDEQCWVATIDWQKFRREITGSPSEPQRDASGAVFLSGDAPTPPPRPASR